MKYFDIDMSCLIVLLVHLSLKIIIFLSNLKLINQNLLFLQFSAPHEHKNGSTPVEIEPDDASVISKEVDDSKCTSPGKEEVTVDLEAHSSGDKPTESQLENYKNRLRKELVSRDGHGEIHKDTTLFLTFKDNNIEKAFLEYREPFSSVPLSASLLVHVVGIFYALLVLPRFLIF